jgi:hypothetical protein
VRPIASSSGSSCPSTSTASPPAYGLPMTTAAVPSAANGSTRAGRSTATVRSATRTGSTIVGGSWDAAQAASTPTCATTGWRQRKHRATALSTRVRLSRTRWVEPRASPPSRPIATAPTSKTAAIGPYVAATADAIDSLELLPEVQSGEFELRLLKGAGPLRGGGLAGRRRPTPAGAAGTGPELPRSGARLQRAGVRAGPARARAARPLGNRPVWRLAPGGQRLAAASLHHGGFVRPLL